MKKIVYAALAAIIALVSCTQEGPSVFRGYYSFKTGGYLDITGQVADSLGTHDTTFVRHLASESGQMHILATEGEDLMVTLNITGGAPVVYRATVSNDIISLQPSLRKVYFTPEPLEGDNELSFLLSTSATGRRYENMILLDFTYEGDFSNRNIEGVVSASHVNCIATENE